MVRLRVIWIYTEYVLSSWRGGWWEWGMREVQISSVFYKSERRAKSTPLCVNYTRRLSAQPHSASSSSSFYSQHATPRPLPSTLHLQPINLRRRYVLVINMAFHIFRQPIRPTKMPISSSIIAEVAPHYLLQHVEGHVNDRMVKYF